MPDVSGVVSKAARNRDLLRSAHKELAEAWYWADRGEPGWAYDHFGKAKQQAKRVKLPIRAERDGASLARTAVQAGFGKASRDVEYWSQQGEPRWVRDAAEAGRNYAKQLDTSFMPDEDVRRFYNHAFETGLTKRWRDANHWAQRGDAQWAHDSLKEARHFSKQVNKPFDEEEAARILQRARSGGR